MPIVPSPLLRPSHVRGLSLAWLGLCLASNPIPAADPTPAYANDRTLAREIRDLTRSHRNLIRSRTLAETLGGREVVMLEIGFGREEERRSRPALLLVAGIEGNDLAGSASAMHWVRHLATQSATNDAIQSLLQSTTLYVLPRLNPDAADAYFAKPREERWTNGRPFDDDHDGLIDEDGAEDLNGDGLITMMRIEDPEGDYFLDPGDARLLISADRTKGEAGRWRVLTEGRDNDGDEAWNEDGNGGVNFNRNFPYDYRFFAADAGLHQISEPETRALADFVVSHSHIGVIFVFGDADNLVKEPKSEGGGKRPPTAVHEDDAPYFRELGKAWRSALGLGKELSERKVPGSFSDWMYFHRGRLALAARAWSPALQLELTKGSKDKPKASDRDSDKEASPSEKGSEPGKANSPDAAVGGNQDSNKPAADAPAEEGGEKTGGKGGAPESGKSKPKPDKRNEEERNFLQWTEKHAPELFVSWTAIDHPDFPDRKVEIGGFAPFAKSVPPESVLEDLLKRQAGYLTDLAGKLPRVGVRKSTLKSLGESVYDLTVQIENTGYLPTAMAQGNTTREVFPVRAVLELPDHAILSGTRRVDLGTLPGSGGMKEARWIFLGAGRREVTLEVVSMLGGRLRHTLELEEPR